MNIKRLSVDLIDVEDRLRPVNGDYVAELAQSFEEKGGEGRGQITPIEVREAGEDGHFRLISGAHRLAAARLSSWKTIQASVIRCTNDEARLREIDENLIRNDLSSLDRAAFMVEREAVWVQLHPDSVRGRAGAAARWHANEATSFARKTAEKLGLTDRTIQTWLALGRATAGLTGDLRARIAASDLAHKPAALREIASIENAALREKVVDAMLSGEKGAPKKVSIAVLRAKGEPEPEKDKDADDYNKFLVHWARCSAEAQANIRAFVIAQKIIKPRRDNT